MTRHLVLLAALMPALASAQVGHVPADSPFRDVGSGTRFGVTAGWYVGAKDPAGVLPQSGPMLGLRWDVHVGGPADLSFRASHVSSERNVIDPTKSEGFRLVEKRSISLGFADLGILFNLTGAKSWHSMMPYVLGSVGVVSDFAGTDVGGFSHGSTFAVGYGLGMRYVPQHSRIGLRAELGSYFYSTQYPTSYYTKSGDGTSVLPTDTPRSAWRNNWTLSAGAMYAFFN